MRGLIWSWGPEDWPVPVSENWVDLPFLVTAVSAVATMPLSVGAKVIGTEIVCPVARVAGRAGVEVPTLNWLLALERPVAVRFGRRQRDRLFGGRADIGGRERERRAGERRGDGRTEGDHLAFTVAHVQPPRANTRGRIGRCGADRRVPAQHRMPFHGNRVIGAQLATFALTVGHPDSPHKGTPRRRPFGGDHRRAAAPAEWIFRGSLQRQGRRAAAGDPVLVDVQVAAVFAAARGGDVDPAAVPRPDPRT